MVTVDSVRPNSGIADSLQIFLLYEEVVKLKGRMPTRMPPRGVRGLFEEGCWNTKLINTKDLIESTSC